MKLIMRWSMIDKMLDALVLIDNSQHFDGKTITQRDMYDQMGGERYTKLTMKSLKENKYIRETTEFKSKRSSAKIKWYITPKGRRFMEDNL